MFTSIDPFIIAIDLFLCKNQNVVKMVKPHNKITGTHKVITKVNQLKGIVTIGIFQNIENIW
ncbi:MAG: hypothetical protein IKL15_00835, partial [Mycoplasmataceae bacterium]|nr:hypothetical protein [Mycoplasmataceae bacterium]